MVKPKINYGIEMIMLICLLFMAVISIIMWIKNYSYGNSLVLIHHTVGTIFLVLLTIHLLMHSKFIIIITKNFFKGKHKGREEKDDA